MEQGVQDPLEYFSNVPNVIDHIFQHFRCNELLNAATISTSYRDYIFNSSACMKKINVVVCGASEFGNIIRNIDDIPKSTRRYVNVKLRMNNLNNLQAVDVMSRSKSWKSVEIYYGGPQFLDLIENIESYCQEVEDFTLRHFVGTFYLDHYDIKPHIRFKKLKKITVDTVNNNKFAFALISYSLTLKKLSLVQVNEVAKLLYELSHLNTFQLEELNISEYSRYNFDHFKVELRKFLEQHRETLKKITFDIWASLPVLKLILSMPKLHHLQLYELAKSDPMINWDEVILPTCSSIKTLHLQDLKDNKSMLKCLLTSCPNLKELQVYELNTENLKIIRSCRPKLEKLGAYFSDVHS